MTNRYKVLVTGANGFIGQHLVEALLKANIIVYALVRSNKYRSTLARDNVIQGDILNKDAVEKAVSGVDIIVHLVAKTHDMSRLEDAVEYHAINVEGTRNILEAGAKAGIRHFVYVSSVKTMTERTDSPIDETYTPAPTTEYGKSKLVAEKLVGEYGSKFGFKTTSLRLPLVYGPGNKGNIFKMIEAIDRGKFAMIGSGENKRSMVYVENVVDSVFAVMTMQTEGNRVFIVTDGVDYSVKELTDIIAHGLNKRVRPITLPMALAKAMALVGDTGEKVLRRPLPFNSSMLMKLTNSLTFSSRAIQNDLQFRPKYNITNTINETIRWYQAGKAAGPQGDHSFYEIN